jgi:hypothetical protein
MNDWNNVEGLHTFFLKNVMPKTKAFLDECPAF